MLIKTCKTCKKEFETPYGRQLHCNACRQKYGRKLWLRQYRRKPVKNIPSLNSEGLK